MIHLSDTWYPLFFLPLFSGLQPRRWRVSCGIRPLPRVTNPISGKFLSVAVGRPESGEPLSRRIRSITINSPGISVQSETDSRAAGKAKKAARHRAFSPPCPVSVLERASPDLIRRQLQMCALVSQFGRTKGAKKHQKCPITPRFKLCGFLFPQSPRGCSINTCLPGRHIQIPAHRNF